MLSWNEAHFPIQISDHLYWKSDGMHRLRLALGASSASAAREAAVAGAKERSSRKGKPPIQADQLAELARMKVCHLIQGDDWELLIDLSTCSAKTIPHHCWPDIVGGERGSATASHRGGSKQENSSGANSQFEIRIQWAHTGGEDFNRNLPWCEAVNACIAYGMYIRWRCLVSAYSPSR